MLLETQTREVSSGGLIQVARATIKSSAKVFNFFSDNTYTQNFHAVIRELVANGVDSHTAAGTPELPVEVWLPTELDPTFRVRDKGIGMSRVFMMTTYTILGDGSTKDTSDNQIGGFGIGRFSAFALGDQYTVRSVHDGVVSIYSVFKDEDGIPTVGLLGERPTDEHNGVEVSFPVKSEDFGKFANAANECLKYFNPLPLVSNGAIDEPDYVMRGPNWAINRKVGPLGIIMGGIRYPISTYSLSYDLRYSDRLAPLLDYGLDLTVPIGTCGVALSRESLAYNEKTFEGITTSLENVLADITDSFRTMFDHYETEWEAKAALALEVPVDQRHSGRGKLLINNAFYRGEPLTPEVTLNSGSYWEIDRRSSGRRGAKNIGSAKWDYGVRNVRLDAFEVVLVDDLPQSPKSATIKRIKTYLETQCNRDKPALVLRDVSFNVDIPNTEFVFTSSLPEPEKAPRIKLDRPKVRMFHLSHLSQAFNPGRYGLSYVRELDYWSQPTTGILVICDNFCIPKAEYNMLMSELVTVEECHFVNTVDGAKMKGWRTLKDVFDERLQSVIAENPSILSGLAIEADWSTKDLLRNLKYLTLEDFPKSKRKTPAARLVEVREKYLSEITPRHRELSQFITSQPPKGLDLAKLRKQFEERHPKANHYLTMSGVIQRNTLDSQIFMELI